MVDIVYAICANDNSGNKKEQEILKRNKITIGDKARLMEANVSCWHTDIHLEGYEDWFNADFFNYIDSDGEKYQLNRKRGFYEFFDCI